MASHFWTGWERRGRANRKCPQHPVQGVRKERDEQQIEHKVPKRPKKEGGDKVNKRVFISRKENAGRTPYKIKNKIINQR